MLSIRDLKVAFESHQGPIVPVDSVDMDILDKETFTIIGESGCGKSLLANSLLGLLPRDAQVCGKVYMDGEEILSLKEKEWRKIRGKRIGLVFQNPSASLNPVFTMHNQLYETLKYSNKPSSREKMVSLLKKTGIKNPLRRLPQYPHQLSGGMKQRFAIALGIATDPEILIADEPTNGLDVTVKLKIVELLSKLHAERSILLITHDLNVAYNLSDKIAVMYAGEMVEIAPVYSFFEKPLHPYSSQLLASHPEKEMIPIPGFTPQLTQRPQGCRFHPRCALACRKCKTEHPQLKKIDEKRYVRCFACA
ncbi:MAG: ABC transporter ATP-binding protein [Methanohalophilus sp.]